MHHRHNSTAALAEPASAATPPLYVTMLIVLGAIREGCGEFEGIAAAAADVAPHLWRPTADVLSHCVMTALESDLIRLSADADAGQVAFALTDAGRQTLADLLRRPVPCQWESLKQAWVAARLRFIDALDPSDRAGEIEALARRYRDSLATLRARCNAARAGTTVPRFWLEREIGRIEWELAWLDRLHPGAGAERGSDDVRLA